MEIGVILSIIVGLGEIMKKQGIKVELLPSINILIGVVANLLTEGVSIESAGYGVLLGLVASGLYDQSKIRKLFKDDEEL